MDFINGRILTRTLIENYGKNPRGWSFAIAPARKYGFFDAIVSSANEAWQIKIDSIYKPSPLMLGVSTELDLSRMNSFSPIPFGYRKLDPRMALDLLKGVSESEGAANERTFTANLSAILASLDPVVPEQGGSYAEGPFVLNNKNAFRFTENQKSLDERLASELHRMMRDKYMSYG
ncbi:MAG: hypothetical protein HYU03_04565 [Thaumarchaeota archaeon]|nr:hypothetical protein [Nitrososphaerota archaeon]MBI3022734.1 hypothetical protein [Nitrososphaerota archaeon]MCS4539947.1 hypothetical protein [Nitrososphaerota archaeon]